uniref:Palmitoyl-protein thioesterase 1 n=1 Tax=Vannella robusta TaxID=1487602 RepID=A0A7S4HJU5_9EUKA
MGGQHQGVFGVPDCSAANHTLCEIMRRMLDLGAYLPLVQEYSVQAQYWHDPIQEQFYADHNIFLPGINNEVYVNSTYKENMLSLQNFAMIKFLNDTVVQPRESEWFGFYAPGQDSEVIPLEQTQLYIDDVLGLQELNNSNRLWMIPCEGNHLEFTNEYFIDVVIGPFLNQTFSS